MYKSIVRPFLFRFNTDRIHESTLKWAAIASRSGLANRLIRSTMDFQSPRLRQEILGMTFRNPVGLAAGFDKNGYLPPLMESLGFGYVEVGSITANPGTGNPLPRSFRLPLDESLINRMGLNNDGAATILKRLCNHDVSIPIGVNIAKSHDPSIVGEQALDDYYTSFRLATQIADYITLNISCPNTKGGKTFEEPDTLNSLLERLRIGSEATLPPLFVKVSADLDETRLHELIDVSRSHSVSGYVAVNTSSGRQGLKTPREEIDRIGPGGLSGRAIREKSNRLIRQIFTATRGEKPIIGVGGIFSAQDVVEKIRAGADLVQIYTGMVYQGPGLIRRINRDLDLWLQQHDIDHIYQIRSRMESMEPKSETAPRAE